MVPTPYVPFAVLHLKLSAGVMVTASHNPKDDNGYKVHLVAFPIYFVLDHHFLVLCTGLLGAMAPRSSHRMTSGLRPPSRPTCSHGKRTPKASLLHDPYQVINKKYQTESLKRYCWTRSVFCTLLFVSCDSTVFPLCVLPSETNRSAPVKVTYTAMHGVGEPFARQIFANFRLPPYNPSQAAGRTGPQLLHGGFPESRRRSAIVLFVFLFALLLTFFCLGPAGKGALKLAMETADAAGSTLIIANDPDADRMAAAEKRSDGQWHIFNGNEIAALLADWVWTNYRARNPRADPSKCVMLASTVSSKFIKAMADKEGFQFTDTLTGFKWMGNVAADKLAQGLTFLFAYEVEIGLAA